MDEPELLRTSQLRAMGYSKTRLREAVARGTVIRLRRGAYCMPDASPECVEAGRMRGILTCLSELRRLGVFVLEDHFLHIYIDPRSSRLPQRSRTHRTHRDVLRRSPHPHALTVAPLDALVHSAHCLDPRGFVATVDSALHLGILRFDEIDELFGALPRRHKRLRRLVDARAESGSESLMRLILRSIGCSFDVQVVISGVGRVDFVVDGWLIIECDSRAYHSTWESQRRDRRRDQAAAERGFATYRPIAEDIMWRHEDVRAAVIGLLARRR